MRRIRLLFYLKAMYMACNNCKMCIMGNVNGLIDRGSYLGARFTWNGWHVRRVAKRKRRQEHWKQEWIDAGLVRPCCQVLLSL